MGRRAPALGYGITAVLGVAGITGYLLASGAAAPAVADAVSAVASATGLERPDSDQELVASYSYPSSSSTTDQWADNMWMDDKRTPEWSGVRGVPSVGRPSSPSLPSRPTIEVPENVHRFFPRNGAVGAAEMKLEPMHSCFQQRGPAAQVPRFAVTAGVRSASMTWWDIGDPDTQSYAITAVPTGGGKGKVVTVNVPSPGGCKQATASMSGLLTGQVYRFWLTATNKSPINGRIYRPSRGQSNSIVIK